jgi:hypothetical protein
MSGRDLNPCRHNFPPALKEGGGVRLLVPFFLVRRFGGYEVPYKYTRKK